MRQVAVVVPAEETTTSRSDGEFCLAGLRGSGPAKPHTRPLLAELGALHYVPSLAMKEGIHPDYPAARVTCACGNTFVSRSTRGDFQVDVCGACHPFYTGTQKLIDTAGRVDRFRKRYEKTAASKSAAASKAEAK